MDEMYFENLDGVVGKAFSNVSNYYGGTWVGIIDGKHIHGITNYDGYYYEYVSEEFYQAFANQFGQ